mmetsp:Transcript_25451/g.61549  ORF Transcript_25451/g.61549 Transcript_25451/m.61549 type:complete len:245 (+) Transcript_25451:816-1550(+)
MTKMASSCTDSTWRSLAIAGMTPASTSESAMSSSCDMLTKTRATLSCTDAYGKSSAATSRSMPPGSCWMRLQLLGATTRLAIARVACNRLVSPSARGSVSMRIRIASSSPIGTLSSSHTARLAIAHSACSCTSADVDWTNRRIGRTASAWCIGIAFSGREESVASAHAASSWYLSFDLLAYITSISTPLGCPGRYPPPSTQAASQPGQTISRRRRPSQGARAADSAGSPSSCARCCWRSGWTER